MPDSPAREISSSTLSAVASAEPQRCRSGCRRNPAAAVGQDLRRVLRRRSRKSRSSSPAAVSSAAVSSGARPNSDVDSTSAIGSRVGFSSSSSLNRSSSTWARLPGPLRSLAAAPRPAFPRFQPSTLSSPGVEPPGRYRRPRTEAVDFLDLEEQVGAVAELAELAVADE